MATRTPEIQAAVDRAEAEAKEKGLPAGLSGELIDELERITEVAKGLSHDTLAHLFASMNVAYQISDPAGYYALMTTISGAARGALRGE